MKSFLLLFGLSWGLGLSCFAQEPAPASRDRQEAAGPCLDKYLHGEMVDLNKDFARQGFSLELFKILSFPENSYVPVAVNLEQGQMYQINFVANRDFQKASLVLLDKDKRELIDKKYKGKNSQQHWFSQSVAAPYTGTYWIILTQKAKGQGEVCGGLSVLKASGYQEK
jgi:hypothetical protein